MKKRYVISNWVATVEVIVTSNAAQRNERSHFYMVDFSSLHFVPVIEMKIKKKIRNWQLAEGIVTLSLPKGH